MGKKNSAAARWAHPPFEQARTTSSVNTVLEMPRHFIRSSSLYPGHVPTGRLGKLLLAADSAFRAVVDPRDATSVAVVGEATGEHALRRLHARMERHPVGLAVLHDRPLIDSSTLDALHDLPKSTLGGAYAAFLRSHAFDPDERTAVRFVDNADLAYVMTRYRQVHDLWHTLYDLPPTLLGEVALKWLEAAQTGLPMCAAAAAGGGLRLPPTQRAVVRMHVIPWAARHAASSVDLMSVYYEQRWEQPLSELREELHLEMPPSLLTSRKVPPSNST